MTENIKIHGSLVMYHGAGVLIIGASGAGKSDLALRLLDDGAELVSDDQVCVSKHKDGLIATAPKYIKSLLEIRGIGIVRVPAIAQGHIDVVISLMDDLNEMERMPIAQTHSILGVSLPKWDLYPFELSTLVKIKKMISLQANPDDLMG